MFFAEFVSFLLLIICVLVSVAFLTLFERSGLGYVQIRSGPVSVGYGGVLQPFADAIKLFTSENIQPSVSNFFPYLLCPVLSMFLALLVWVLVPYFTGLGDVSLGVLFLLCVVGVSVYAVLGSGWFSNSKYALLGCLRFIAQTISYEVSLAMVVVGLVALVGEYSLASFWGAQELCWFGVLFMPFMLVWVVVMLAETNRTPFDFAEGESELVSGFNIEYGAGGFALIFMAEYASILMMSLIFCLLFLGGYDTLIGVSLTTASFLFVWVRGLLPRLRYDMLMYLAWSDLLPLVLSYFLLIVGASSVLCL